MKVIKRDQSKQKYDFAKIHKVVTKAFNSVDQEVPEKFLEQLEASVLGLFKKKEEIDVEEIQDCIQKEKGKSPEELKIIADNILFEIKNGPPFVYS